MCIKLLTKKHTKKRGEQKMVEISKKELENRYRTTKSTELAKQLGVSVPTLMRYLREYGIAVKKQGDGWAVRGKKIKIIE